MPCLKECRVDGAINACFGSCHVKDESHNRVDEQDSHSVGCRNVSVVAEIGISIVSVYKQDTQPNVCT